MSLAFKRYDIEKENTNIHTNVNRPVSDIARNKVFDSNFLPIFESTKNHLRFYYDPNERLKSELTNKLIN